MENNHQKNINRQSSKPILQSISIFNYYLKQLFPTLFQDSPFPPHSFAKLRATQRSLTYNYVHEVSAGIEGVTPNTILEAAKQTYSAMQGVTASDCGFERKTTLKLPYLPVWREIPEKIDFVVINESQKEKEIKVRNFCSPHKILKQANTNKGLERKKSHPLISVNNIEPASRQQIFQLYIIHHSQSSIQWENFVERFRFESKPIEGEQRSLITYQSTYVYNSELKLDQSHKLLQLFYQKSLFDTTNANKLPIVQRLCSKLRSLVQTERATMKVKFQSVSFDQAHRRELRLNQTQRALFNALKVKAFALFGSLNRNRDANRYFLQNLVCRMMENQNYAESESWESIKYYLEFERKMRANYRWSDFEKFDKMNIFSYVGKDRMGRPILLNRIRNILCSKIENFDEFFYYHLYLFEIYMQDQMEGWVDQFIVITDASNQISDNTNLSFTKRIILQALKVTMGRVYRIVAFDVGFIGTALYRLLNPLLPKSFTDRVKILGEDKRVLLEQLRLCISDQVIPGFLGGKNITIDSDSKGKYQQRLNTERTSDNSIMLRQVKSLKAL